MSAIEGGGRNDRAGQAPGGNGRLQGSEPFDQDQTEGGPSRLIKIRRGKIRPGKMSGYGWR
jgi:hypothetical protein